jgi:hypothetical protein
MWWATWEHSEHTGAEGGRLYSIKRMYYSLVPKETGRKLKLLLRDKWEEHLVPLTRRLFDQGNLTLGRRT